MPNQRRTLEFFTAFYLLQPSWAGALLLGTGLDETGRALAMASLAAGAAALFLEEDPAHLRTAAREGCTTFTVSTLDEALRTLKNEVRLGHAIAVALSGNSKAWLHEMVERGVQPQYLAVCRKAAGAPLDKLQARGARTLSGFGLYTTPSGTNLEPIVASRLAQDWHITEDATLTLADRRAKDAVTLASLNGDSQIEGVMRQWLRAAPTLFPRALDRATWKSKIPDKKRLWS